MNEGVVWLWHAASADWGEGELAAHFSGALSSKERETMRQFVREPDRQLYLLAHGLLGRVLSEATGRRPGDVEIQRQEGGKPYVAGGPHFSLTHAHGDGAAGVAVVALARAPVGIDVESLGRSAELSELLGSHYTPEERRMLANLPGEERRERMVWLWTAKEAVIKATGEGLRTAPNSVDVAWGEDGILRVTDWRLTRFRCDGFVGTIAAPQTSAVVVHPAILPDSRAAAPGAALQIIL